MDKYKYKLLGFVNLLLIILFVFILFKSDYSLEPFISIWSFFKSYTPNIILLFFVFINTFLVYKLLIKLDKKLSIKLYLALTLSTPFWFLLLFVGYFSASNIVFPIICIGLVFSIYYLFSKSSKRIAFFLSFVTLLLSIIVFTTSFEEDYCSKKGFEVDKNGPEMVVATKEDELALKEYQVVEGIQIGVNFRTHMLCHTSFSFTKALKDNY